MSNARQGETLFSDLEKYFFMIWKKITFFIHDGKKKYISFMIS
jgi:hypothetical protein